MNNISFKAQLQGIGDWQKQIEFETQTAYDSNAYKMTYLYKDKDTDWDVFQLSYKDNEIAKYPNIKNSKKNKEDYKLEELLTIYKLLRLKGALKLIEQKKKEKINIDFNNYIAELDKNEGIEPDIHIIGNKTEE